MKQQEVPVYISGDALGLLRELADAIESARGPLPAVVVGPDDAKALRWALERLTAKQP